MINKQTWCIHSLATIISFSNSKNNWQSIGKPLEPTAKINKNQEIKKIKEISLCHYSKQLSSKPRFIRVRYFQNNCPGWRIQSRHALSIQIGNRVLPKELGHRWQGDTGYASKFETFMYFQNSSSWMICRHGWCFQIWD